MRCGRAGAGRPIVQEAAPSCHLSLAELIDDSSRRLPNYVQLPQWRALQRTCSYSDNGIGVSGWGSHQALEDWLEEAGTLPPSGSRGWRANPWTCQEEFTCRQSINVCKSWPDSEPAASNSPKAVALALWEHLNNAERVCRVPLSDFTQSWTLLLIGAQNTWIPSDPGSLS